MFILNIGQVGGAGEAKPPKVSDSPQIQKAQDAASIEEILLQNVSTKDVGTLGAKEETAKLWEQIDAMLKAGGATNAQKDTIKDLVNKWIPKICNPDYYLWNIATFVRQFMGRSAGSQFGPLGIFDHFNFTAKQKEEIGRLVGDIVENVYKENGFFNPDSTQRVNDELFMATWELHISGKNYKEVRDLDIARMRFFEGKIDFKKLQEAANIAKKSYLNTLVGDELAGIRVFNIARIDKFLEGIQANYVTDSKLK